jgi:carbohydrate kinase (thermoresistant glucokinase family)
MTHRSIPGLRSPHARVGPLVYFGRMLDKIRLEARGALPDDYRANLGGARPTLFDGRCCRFLGIEYDRLRERTLAGGCDEEIAAWALSAGTRRTDEECAAWNHFMVKLGWRDERSATLRERCVAYGFAPDAAQTLFELLDLDEGRSCGATRSWEGPQVSVIIVMGVAGSGKSTVGAAVASSLGWDFIEADTHHPEENVRKMAAGIPLSDADRAPWLAAVRAEIDRHAAAGRRVVASCSALKASYRDVLAPDPGCSRFVHADGDPALIEERLRSRTGHFARENLLRSQLETLERPLGALRVDIADPVDTMVARIRSVLALP